MTVVESEQPVSQKAAWLIGLGALSGLGYALLLWLSWSFADSVLPEEKPTMWMLLLFGGEFIGYWLALRLALRLQPTRWLLGGIFAGACLFRGVLLPSIPMHEIDIYRYIWDGAVLADGVSPYRYSPQQVRDAINSPVPVSDPTLQQLVELQATSSSLSKSLFIIHQEHLPSPYPIVSQAVFAMSAIITPDNSTAHARLVIMKSLLVLMDLATLLVVMLLLRDVGMHPGWSLAYGWCPLMMKEVANGGHLDSIAIFLTTLAIWLLVKASRRAGKSMQKSRIALTGLALAFAIGAKLYPVVLLPLFLAIWLRRHGWGALGVGLATTTLLSTALLYPLFGPATPPAAPTEPAHNVNLALNPAGQLNVPQASPQQTAVDPSQGVQAFLNHWEMNDLLFMVVLENLRQQDDIKPEQKPWFVITSDKRSRAVVTRWATLKQRLTRAKNAAAEITEPLTSSQLRAASFSLARLLTGGVFALIACVLAWRAAGQNDPQAWCHAGMLTLAWFWLTCPTQNPWYWCWVLPLLPFARYRTWYFVAAMTMLYYLRFWFTAHYPSPPVLGTPYNGAYFFYFVIAWVEFVPCLLGLAVEWFWWRKTAANLE